LFGVTPLGGGGVALPCAVAYGKLAT
jgi:hypothetical protein